MPINNPQKRLELIDLFKIFIAFNLTAFHLANALLKGSGEIPENYYLSFLKDWLIVTNYAGLYVVGIAFFLYGFFNKGFNVKTILVLTLGLVGMQMSESVISMEQFELHFRWGLFAYLFVSYLVVVAIRFLDQLQFQKMNIGYFVSILIISLAFQPLYFYSSIFNHLNEGLLKDALVGNFKDSYSEDWFLIPWIFYPVLFYRIGMIFNKFQNYLDNIKRIDILFVGLFLLSLWIEINSARKYTISESRFYFNVFVRDPAELLWLVMFPLVIMRLSLLKRIANFKWLYKLNRLQLFIGWTQHFWLAYFSQLVFVQTFAYLNNGTYYTENLIIHLLFVFTFFYSSINAHIMTKKPGPICQLKMIYQKISK